MKNYCLAIFSVLFSSLVLTATAAAQESPVTITDLPSIPRNLEIKVSTPNVLDLSWMPAQPVIEAGGVHACAIYNDGLRCWGSNEYNQLGESEDSEKSLANHIPFRVQGLSTGVTAIALGFRHSCVIHGGIAKCWGDNTSGQLGNNSTDSSTVPVLVQGLGEGVTMITAAFAHTCAIDAGAAKCWGDNATDQLGVSVGGGPYHTATQVVGLSTGVTTIATGVGHSCAIQNDRVKCWGSNSDKQLGSSVQGNVSVPMLVDGLSGGLTAIAVGNTHSCVVQNGVVKCWGDQHRGQLGNGVTQGSSPRPEMVRNLAGNVIAITAGASHTCAVVDGGAKCWGSNDFGQVGNDNRVGGIDSTPKQVLIGRGVTTISAGGSQTCAIQNGAAKCWGSNSHGQLGARLNMLDNVPSPIPLPVIGLTSSEVIVSNWRVRWKSEEDSEQESKLLLSPQTTYRITNLRAKRSYTISVVAIDPSEEQREGGVATVSAVVFGRPKAPEIQSIISGPGSLQVTWNSPNDGGLSIQSFNVYWETDDTRADSDSRASSTTVTVDTPLSFPTSLTISNLIRNAFYRITVSAVNNLGESELSEISMIRTLANPPSQPTNVGTNQGVASIRVGWDIPDNGGADITEFIVYWGELDVTENSVVLTYESENSGMLRRTTYSISYEMLFGNRTYQVAVAARNIDGLGDLSDVTTFETTFNRDVPTAPRNLMLRPGIGLLEVSWDIPFDQGASKIIRYEATLDSGAPSHDIVTRRVMVPDGSNQKSFTAPNTANKDGLVPGTYTVTVRAFNTHGGGTRAVSRGRSITIPDSVQDLIIVKGNKSLYLYWEPGYNGGRPASYRITWSNSEEGRGEERIGPDKKAYVITKLDNVAYSVRVFAFNDVGESEARTGSETPDDLLPSIPRNLQTEVFGPNTLDLSWDPTNPTIVAGGDHSCAIYNSTVKCWGYNGLGQVGGSSMEEQYDQWIDVQGLGAGVTMIAAGGSHNCAIQDGAAKCWGSNLQEQLGKANPDPFEPFFSGMPLLVSSLTENVTAIAAGLRHSCAIHNGAAKCWGDHGRGQLGDPTISSIFSSTPVFVQNLSTGVTAIAAGGSHSCAIHNGAAKCWGEHRNGQLGDPSALDGSIPVDVQGLNSGVTAIAVGNSHSCAVQNNQAKCWGRNDEGQLGGGTTGAFRSTPKLVEGLNKDVTAISAGSSHGCAVQNNQAKCWGRNQNGRLGDGTTDNSDVPVLVKGLSEGVTVVAAGSEHSCAIHNGAAKCWGGNVNGQLGIGRVANDFISVQMQVLGLTGDEVIMPDWRVRWTDKNGNLQESEILSNSQTTYRVTNVELKQNNVILVAAVDPADDRREGGVAKILVVALVVPEAPKIQSITRPSPGSLLVTWNFLDDGGLPITAFNVYAETNDARASSDSRISSKTVTVDTSLSLPTSLTISNLIRNATYKITVSALSNVGESDLSEARASTIIRTSFTVPSKPSDVMTELVDKGSVAVSWNVPDNGGADITEFIVYWGVFAVNETSKIVTYKSGSTLRQTNIITGLFGKTLYRVAVTALNVAGPSELSKVSTILTSVGLLSTPRNLVLIPQPNALRISWDIPSDTSGVPPEYYEVSWVSSSFSGYLRVEPANPNQQSFVISPDLPSASYVVTVTAFNNQGKGASAESVGRPLSSPDPVQNLIALKGNKSLYLYWEPGYDGGQALRSYQIEWASSSTTIGPDKTAYTIKNLSGGVRYDVLVSAVNSIGTSRVTVTSQTPDDLPPGIPRNLQARVSKPSTLDLSWEPANPTVVAGGLHSCAIYNDTARCWGDNRFGQVGDGSIKEQQDRWRNVQGLDSGVTVITAGENHSCAVQHGVAKCWGLNLLGQLGKATSEDFSRIPLSVSSLTKNVTAISAGTNHSCAIQNGAARCWGSNEYKQLGKEIDGDFVSTPVFVQNLSMGVKAIAAGRSHSCAIHNDTVRCWGDSRNGKLGHNILGNISIPMLVPNLTGGLTAIAVGNDHSCVVQSNQTKCWGDNSSSQLGYRTNDPFHSTPRLVQGLSTDVTAISVGGTHSCVVQDNQAKCWGGNNSGQLGDGTDNNNNVPVLVRGLVDGVTMVAAGFEHSCAIHDGATRCWGNNERGQLGNGVSGTNNSTPVQVSGLTGDEVVTSNWLVRWTDKSGEVQKSAILPASQTTYRIINIQLGGNYIITVAAIDSKGGEAAVAELPLFSVPEVPEIQNVTPSYRTIRVNWTMPDNDGGAEITTYTIYWQVASESTESEMSTNVRASQTNYDILRLTPDTTYKIAVTAVNSIGEGPRSTTILTRTLETKDPSLVTVTVTTGDKFLNVTWEAPEEIGDEELSGYRIYWNGGAISSNSGTELLPIEPQSYSISGLMNGVAYQVTVEALNSAGTSRATAMGTPQGVPDQVILGDVTPSYRTIGVSWEAPDNQGARITTYTIYWQVASESTESEMSTNVRASQTNYDILRLTPDTTYKIAVAAVNGIGESPRLATALTRTLETKDPSPVMVAVTAGNELLDVVWEEPEEIGDEELSGYRIYWSGGAISSNSGTELLPIEPQSYSISGLTNGVAYQVTVEALNSAGTSRVTATGTPQGVPDQVILGDVTPSYRTIRVNWKIPDNDGGAKLRLTRFIGKLRVKVLNLR